MRRDEIRKWGVSSLSMPNNKVLTALHHARCCERDCKDHMGCFRYAALILSLVSAAVTLRGASSHAAGTPIGR